MVCLHFKRVGSFVLLLLSFISSFVEYVHQFFSHPWKKNELCWSFFFFSLHPIPEVKVLYLLQYSILWLIGVLLNVVGFWSPSISSRLFALDSWSVANIFNRSKWNWSNELSQKQWVFAELLTIFSVTLGGPSNIGLLDERINTWKNVLFLIFISILFDLSSFFFLTRTFFSRLCSYIQIVCSGLRIYNTVGMNVYFMHLFLVSFSFIVIEARFSSIHTHTAHSVSKWKGIFTRRKTNNNIVLKC